MHISILYRHCQAAMAKALEPLGIGMGQYPYILSVCESPGISQDKLTGRLMLNKSSVARAIAQLEKAGFLRRDTDPADKRSYRLYPTGKGMAALPEIFRQLDLLAESLTLGFSPQEKAAADGLLQRMSHNAVHARQKE